jgi:hypothetical protein
MGNATKVKRIIGFVLHALIAAMMILAGSFKLFASTSPQIVEGMGKVGLGDKILLIGAGELISAVLLLIPFTRSLGVLLVSAFWGGVICVHMTHGESYAFYAVLLALTWVGAYLRDPLTFSSFSTYSRPQVQPEDASAPAAVEG